jgi:hypothetical protein
LAETKLACRDALQERTFNENAMKTLFKQITQKLSENKDRHTDLKKTVKSKVAI